MSTNMIREHHDKNGILGRMTVNRDFICFKMEGDFQALKCEKPPREDFDLKDRKSTRLNSSH